MTARLLDACRMPKSRLGRELILVLLIKAVVIGLAAVFIFGPSRMPRIDAAKVAAHLVDAPKTDAPKTTVSETTGPETASKTAPPRRIVP